MVEEQEKIVSELRIGLGYTSLFGAVRSKLLEFAEERKFVIGGLSRQKSEAEYSAGIVNVVLELSEKYSPSKVREALQSEEFKRYFGNYFLK